MTDNNAGTEIEDIDDIDDMENEDSEDSSTESNDTDDTHSPDGDENNQDDPDKDKPFHEHPRWKQRETDWDRKFQEQEAKHQRDLEDIRKEFGDSRRENAEQVEKPSWFGGTDEQWKAYRKDRDTELKQAEERAYERLNKAKSAEEKAVEEATAFMHSEVAAIESDKTLNPTGAKIDLNKLVKIAMDEKLIDSQNRWNYRAAWRILRAETAVPAKPAPVVTKERKAIAGATGSESKPESKPVTYKTSADFKKNKPW